MTNFPGGDTLLIVSKTPTGQKDSMGEDVTTDSVVSVYGCVFETERISEVESDVTTSNERGMAFLPYVEGVTTGVTNENWIRPQRPDALAQRDYKVFGRPAIEYDINGQPDHVWIVCEWHGG